MSTFPMNVRPVADGDREPQLGWSARISAPEIRRRICHMSPGLLALALTQVPHQRPLTLAGRAILLAVVVLAGVIVHHAYPLIARCGENRWTMNIVKYAIPVVSLVLLFPANLELAVVVVTVIAFGDGSATLFGLLVGQRRLPWNSTKTWAGLLGFAICAIPTATLGFWLESHPAISWMVAAACVSPAVILGMIAESLPWKSSDNLRVGLAAAVGVVATHQILLS